MNRKIFDYDEGFINNANIEQKTHFDKYETDYGTLVIGDCRDVMPSFPGKSVVDLVLTDPPYKGVNPVSGFDSVTAKKYNVDKNDIDYYSKDVNYMDWIPKLKYILKDTGVVVIFEDADNIFDLYNAIINSGLHYGGLGIWYIPNKLSGKGNSPLTSYEIWMWCTRSKNYYYNSDYILHDVLIHNKENDDKFISDKRKIFGKKPVKILTSIINAFTPSNGTVLDCFAGSGSTCLAARLTNRYFFAIEIDKDLKEDILHKSLSDIKDLRSY